MGAQQKSEALESEKPDLNLNSRTKSGIWSNLEQMKQVARDEGRERRIQDEVVVDAYGEEERAMGWFYYLEDRCSFPFTAVCRSQRPISPLAKGAEVEVLGLAPEDECEREVFVEIRWKPRRLAVPLAQLQPISPDEPTMEAVADWHYWMARGYQF